MITTWDWVDQASGHGACLTGWHKHDKSNIPIDEAFLPCSVENSAGCTVAGEDNVWAQLVYPCYEAKEWHWDIGPYGGPSMGQNSNTDPPLDRYAMCTDTTTWRLG